MNKEKAVHKLSGGFSKLIKSSLLDRFKHASIEIQNAIIDEYDSELVDVVTDRESKTNPNLYREDFVKRLSNFKYVEDDGVNVSINVPDMNNFDFSGRLRVLQAIMTGLPGLYVEINEDDYMSVFGKKPVNQDPLDANVAPSEIIYLVGYSSKIRQAERDLNKKFVRYPFSNSPPIRIFESGIMYAADNIDTWIQEAIEKANKTFVTNYKGANL